MGGVPKDTIEDYAKNETEPTPEVTPQDVGASEEEDIEDMPETENYN